MMLRRQFLRASGIALALPSFLPLRAARSANRSTAPVRRMVFFGSNLGDASSHSVKNLPVLLGGGGFRHGQHLKFDASDEQPLCNLFVSMLQRLDLEMEAFGTSTGSLTGLEIL